MKKIHSKGFTLIELLFVVVIMGFIASIIVPRMQSAREKGVDGLVKTNLSGLSAQAEIVLGADGDYAAICSDSKMAESLQVASEKVTGATDNYVCSDEINSWVASTPLKRQNQVNGTSGEDYWCVDKSGQAVLLDDQIAVDATSC